MKLVDTLDLGSSAARCGSSSLPWGTINNTVITEISELDKQQYARTASFFVEWLVLHPYPEEDDDFHRTIRMSARTYLSLYENFLQLFTRVIQKDYINPKNNSKLH